MCRNCKHSFKSHVDGESFPRKREQVSCTECKRLHRKRCIGWEPSTDPVDDLAIIGSDMGYDRDQHLQKMQEMINSGDIWKFEGSMGRAADDALASGACYLPRYITTDYYGNRLPCRQYLQPGSKGTLLNHYNWLMNDSD